MGERPHALVQAIHARARMQRQLRLLMGRTVRLEARESGAVATGASMRCVPEGSGGRAAAAAAVAAVADKKIWLEWQPVN